MATEGVRKLLARALFDPDFAEQLSTDPRSATTEYDLSEEERELFESRGAPLYDYIERMLVNPEAMQPPTQPVYAPTTTTQTQTVTATTTNTQVVAVVVVAAIVAFVAPLSPMMKGGVEQPDLIQQLKDEYSQLIEDIRSETVSEDRIQRILDLINRITSEGLR